MARLVTDRGTQRIQTAEGVKVCHIYEMDCGCEIRVDERVFMLGSSRSSGVDLRGRLSRVADAHDCDVVVHHAPESYRREVRQRGPRVGEENRYMGLRQSVTHDVMRYMGMDVKIDPSLSPGEVRFDSWEEPPKTAAKARDLNETLRAAFGPSPLPIVQAANPLGFAMPKPEAKQPEKQEPVKLDRFQLIEID